MQWAKLKGCRVAGTCGDASKAAMLKELGCDVVVRRRLRLLTFTAAAGASPAGVGLEFEPQAEAAAAAAVEANTPFTIELVRGHGLPVMDT